MAIYNKVAKALVYDLINEANPNLTKKVSDINTVLGAPSAIVGAVFPAPNTNIVLSQAPGTSDFIGRQTLKYRRLDLSQMFRGITAQVTKFASKGMATAGSVVFTVYELLNDINTLYGLKLTEDDINNGNILRGSTLQDGQYVSTVTVTVKATSLGYVGSFALKWLNTPQSLKDMITNTDLDGRIFPGGNLFDETHKDIVSSRTYGLDASATLAPIGAAWTPFAKALLTWNTWSSIYNNTILPYLRAATGQSKWKWASNGNYLTSEGDIGGMQHALYQLPAAGYPEGNSRFFGWVLVVYIPEDCPWASGEIILHFNKN